MSIAMKKADAAVSQKAYRVLIADDHAIVRSGLKQLLEAQPGFEVCCEATTGVEAVEQVKKNKPDMVLLDLTMPDMNGLDAARQIRETTPSTDILILSMHYTEEIAREILRTGARGYVLKSDANAELLTAVNRVRRGEQYFTGVLAASMAETFAQAKNEDSDDPVIAGTPLTPREAEIIQLLAQGKSNKQTAAVLGVSTRTVESHRNHVMRKMEFESFSDLVRFAVRKNLVEP